MKEKLIKRLENACWAFYHIHRGTAGMVESKSRIYSIADTLQKEYGVTDDELTTICERAMA